MEERDVINQMNLSLGDIIEIKAPTNMNLNENTYYIDYIDHELIVLINVANLGKTNLYMKDGFITDESISQINILSRSEEKGYVLQNSLTVHSWIEIHFDDGDTPEIIFGEITNVENDMIEITRYPDFMKLYIDFEYKGLPRYLPIVSITLRDKPENLTHEPRDIASQKSTVSYDEKGEATYEEGDEVPDENIFETLEELYKETNDIIFGEDLDDVVLNVEIPESQRKYGIEIQANSLLDELLSTIPNEKRTKAVKQQINTLINRYKQLRFYFSKFDEHNDVIGYVYKGPVYKPLVDNMNNLRKNVKWIVPVVKQKRDLYVSENTVFDDYTRKQLPQELEEYDTYNNEYKNSATLERYQTFYKKLQTLFLPFMPSDGVNLLTEKQTIYENIDTIVQNLPKFGSSVFAGENVVSSGDFVVQRYNLGEYKKSAQVSSSGNTVFYRTQMTPNDKMSIDSLLFLPEIAVKNYKTSLVGTSILTKVNNNNFLSLFKLFESGDEKTKDTIISTIISDLDEEYNYDGSFLTDFKHYLLDNTLYEEQDKYAKLLNVLIPPTRELFRQIRKYLKFKLNVHSIVKELEPFHVYMDDICYAQLQEFRFYIKNQLKEFKEAFKKKEREFQDFRLNHPTHQQKMNTIERIFFDDHTLYDYIQDGYKLPKPMRNIELLQYFTISDFGRLMYDLITVSNMRNLMSAEDILSHLEPAKLDDHGAHEKISSRNCIRRVLSKSYGSLLDMRKDNGEAEIFFDKEYDDTPYSVLQDYKKEQSSMEPALFRDFLKENIKNKHFYEHESLDDEFIEDLLDDLIGGKKRVREGHYAILQLVPTLPEGIDPNTLSVKDKRQLEIEKETRKKVGYYVRKRNQWVYDSSIDPEMFIDNNALFCNISKECYQNTQNNVCEPKKTTKMRLDELNKSRMVKEFTNRVQLSIEQLNDYYKEKTAQDFRILDKRLRLQYINECRHNNYIYEFGQLVKEYDVIRSPYLDLCSRILDQEDFVKKQGDILRFIDYYCREPLQDVERVEDQYWYYCKETNTKLIPITSGILAKAYFEDCYGSKLKELCNVYGKMSDDGNAIVDVNSGYELRKIDFVSEESFTEEGFKIISHDILQGDIETRLSSLFNVNAPIFENALTEMIYNITDTICKNISISTDSVSDFVIAQTIELMNVHIEKQEVYEEHTKKKVMKNPKAKPLQYEVYKNRMMFWFITSNIIVAIQTAIPSFIVKKTFPGCVKSFHGYPLSGVEDKSTIEYMACVLNKLGKDIEPWNAIKKVKLVDNVKMIENTLNTFILSSGTVENMYKEKHMYLSENPVTDIPEEIGAQNWLSFLPPLTKINMKSLKSVSRDFEKEFITLIREGNKEQSVFYNIVKSKIRAHGYGVLQMINDIVSQKDPLLKTMAKIPFVDNACCNESIKTPIEYFIEENDNIEYNFQIIRHLRELVDEVNSYSKPNMIFDKRNTKPPHPVVEGLTDQVIYEAFIYYCNLENELPIPDEFLYIFNEKPKDFPQTTLEEKIEYLKTNGKKFSKTDYHILMRKVATKKQILLYESHYDDKAIIFDILEALDNKDSKTVPAVFRTKLYNLYQRYDPSVMVVKEREELTKLKEYLYNANAGMFRNIVIFMDNYSNMSDDQFGKFQKYLLTITEFSEINKDSLYNMINYVKNSCYYLTKMFPSIVRGNNVHNIVHSHWGFSQYHNMDLSAIMNKDYDLLRKFQGDNILSSVLLDVEAHMKDLDLLMEFLPIHYNIEKNDMLHITLFDNDCIRLLYTYYWYSCFFEYISCVDDPAHLLADVESQKQQRRRQKTMASDESLSLHGQGDVEELEINAGNLQDLKRRLGSLLEEFYHLDEQNLFLLNSYEQISSKVAKRRYDEKQRIVQALGDITDKFELEIEDQFKRYKMGAWNLGLTRALVHYDAKLYDAEREQLEINEIPLELDTPVEEPYNEATDISHLGEDYQDGDFYGDYVEND